MIGFVEVVVMLGKLQKRYTGTNGNIPIPSTNEGHKRLYYNVKSLW